jgi:cell division septation protein DedD
MAVRRAAHPVKEKLVQNGIAIVDSRSEKSPTEVYRLVVGTFPSLDQARNCLQRVSPKLKQAYLMSHNGSHGVYCGSFYKEAKAREKLAQYQRSGVHLTLRRDNVSVTRTTILAGSYLSRDEARDISLRLRGLGIPAAIVSGAESLAELRTGPKRDKAA